MGGGDAKELELQAHMNEVVMVMVIIDLRLPGAWALAGE